MTAPRPWPGALAAAEAVARPLGQAVERIRLSVPLGGAAAVLCLGWRASHSWEPERSAVPGVTARGYSKPPDTLTLVEPASEAAMIALSWARGAPDLARYEFRPLDQLSPDWRGRFQVRDPYDDKYGITSAFGGMSEMDNCCGPLVRQIAGKGCADLVREAAAAGYLTYMFCPAQEGRDSPVPEWATPHRLGVPQASDGHVHYWSYVTKPRDSSRQTYQRHATNRQRAYIVALRRATGVDIGAPLPAKLTLENASAMISRLRAIELGGSA